MSKASGAEPLNSTRLMPAQRRTLLTIWTTYGSLYFCRVNIGAAAPGIRSELGIDPFQMGFIQGALKIGYAIGQLINGQLAERFGAKRILLLGMTGSVIACVLFASCTQLLSFPWLAESLGAVVQQFSSLPVNRTISLLFVLWLFNGYCQAGGWPPCVKVMANWFDPSLRGRMMGIIGTSYQLGTSLTLYGAGLLIVTFHNEWRAAFLVPAALLLASTVHTAWRLREHPVPGEPGTDPSAASPVAVRLPLARSLWVTLSNGRIWILAIGLFGLDVVRFGFLDWVPTHLKEVQGIRIDAAGLKAAVLPLGGALGALLSGWVSDRFFGARRAPVIAVSLFMVAVLTVAYQHVAPIGGVATLLCLGSIGVFLYAAQILLVGTAAQDFARLRTSAAAAGFVDFMGYTGAFGGDVVTGYLLKHYDWHAAIHFWAGTAFCSALVVSILWNARADSQGTVQSTTRRSLSGSTSKMPNNGNQ